MDGFHITKDRNDMWRFERDGISMIIEDYEVKNDLKHWIINPSSAIAYFYVDGNIYGIRNKTDNCKTVEDLYERIHEQYDLFLLY